MIASTSSLITHYAALLKSLDFEGRCDREDQLWQLRVNHRTVEWIWESTFAEWSSTTGDLFWIRGKPASGKSTLVDYIAKSDQIQARLRQNISAEWTIVRHFFSGFGADKTMLNNFEGLLRSLLYQFTKKANTRRVKMSGNEPDLGWST